MKILIADKLENSAVALLNSKGFHVEVMPSLKDEALVEALIAHQPQILVVRSTKVNAKMCAATDALELIIRAGAGVNNIDLEAASNHAICVSNCPGMNAVAVAELTIGHLLNADRRIADNIALSKKGEWAKKTFSTAEGVKGKRLGILGFGAIGKAVAARAKALEMEVVAWSSTMQESVANHHGIKWCTDPLMLAKLSDAVSVHLPLSNATEGLLGSSFFTAMRPNALFINTARAEVVDEAALISAIKSGNIRASLDVISNEPKSDGPFTHELASMEQVYLTHHIGASTQEAQVAVAHEAVRVATLFRDAGHAEHCVNLATQTLATHLLVIRHQDRVGVLAQILAVLRAASINVQSMSNEIFLGERAAACARIQLSNAPSVQVSAQLRSLDDVISYNIVGVDG
jgi:D-3-phosphoglycerate dehydrogenase